MIGSTRRIYLYWLLLLLPALAVGWGSIVLLRHEQRRLDAEARAAAATQRAAIQARARLIAENVELLVGEVEDGLMTTLETMPSMRTDAALADWQRSNPLVQTTFRVGPDHRVEWISNERVRGLLEGWLKANLPVESAPVAKERLAMDERTRRDVTGNVSMARNLRSSLQYEARQNASAVPLMKIPETQVNATEAHGWIAWRGPDALHLVGWRETPAGKILGVEMNLARIADRFGELLPREGDFVNAFVIRDVTGAAVQSRSYGPRNTAGRLDWRSDAPTVSVPLAANMLPGWEVVGYVRTGYGTNGSGGGFFFVGALLVGIFVAAIVSGGSLLLWQARRSETEARQKTSFVANVSHEFKTPLTTIRLYAELLEQGRVRDEAQRGEFLRTIGRETQRLARLVNNALDFSRLEQGRKKYAVVELDLPAEVNRLLDTHAPRIAEAGLALHRMLPEEPLTVRTDRDALGQILLNLIDNACKYAATGGELAVGLEARPAGGAAVRVADRGPGVTREHRERIFEKFHRVDDTLTAERAGAGLGLSIARQLARGLGGELSYAPRTGGGAEFVLELP